MRINNAPGKVLVNLTLSHLPKALGMREKSGNQAKGNQEIRATERRGRGWSIRGAICLLPVSVIWDG